MNAPSWKEGTPCRCTRRLFRSRTNRRGHPRDRRERTSASEIVDFVHDSCLPSSPPSSLYTSSSTCTFEIFSVTSCISSYISALKTPSSSSTLSHVFTALRTSSSVRPEARSTNKLSVNTRGIDLASKSLALYGMDIFLTILHRSSKAAASLSSRSRRVSLPLSAFSCSLGRMVALTQHLMTVWSEELPH